MSFMKKTLFLILLIPSISFSSFLVCHEAGGKTYPKNTRGPICRHFSDTATGGITVHDRVKGIMRKFPYVKWNDPSNEPIEMTQANKDAFNVAAALAREAALRTSAKRKFNGQTVDGQVLRALVKVLINESNTLRAWITNFKTETANASNLTNFKTRVAGLPSLSSRTLAQAKTAIQNSISSGDVDE